MYLLLVENDYISSREINHLLVKHNIDCEIVNCSSSEALLDIAKKLSPDMVIIDFDFYIVESAKIVQKLRQYSPKTYLLAFINSDHFDSLHRAINFGIDDYMVKPLRREDVMLRIKMGLQRKSAQAEQFHQLPAGVETAGDDEDRGKITFVDTVDAWEQKFYEAEEQFVDDAVAEHEAQKKSQLHDELFSYADHDQEQVDEATVGSEEGADRIQVESAGKEDYIDDLFSKSFEPAGDLDEVRKEAHFKEGLDEPEPERTTTPVDDLELFGAKKPEQTAVKKNFEELFGKTSAQSSRKISKGPSARESAKAKPGKVEYISFPQKTAGAGRTVSSAEPDETDLFEDKSSKEAGYEKSSGDLEKAKGRSFSKVAGNILTAVLLLMLLTLSAYLIQSRLSGGSPAIAGYQMYVVLSGSMRPAFDTGSLVFVKPTEPSDIVEGNIITFSSQGDADRLTTHRVVEINRENGLSFITRGDANNVNDPNPVQAENLVGKVAGSAPYIGYVLGFAQTRQGLILLIFVPGALILILELRRLFVYMVEAKVEKIRASTTAEPASFTNRTDSLAHDTAALGDGYMSNASHRRLNQ